MNRNELLLMLTLPVSIPLGIAIGVVLLRVSPITDYCNAYGVVALSWFVTWAILLAAVLFQYAIGDIADEIKSGNKYGL